MEDNFSSDQGGGGSQCRDESSALHLLCTLCLLLLPKLHLRSSGVRSQRLRTPALVQPPHFTGEETEAQRGKVTCPESQSRKRAEPGLRHRDSPGGRHWWCWQEGSTLCPSVHTQAPCVQLCGGCTPRGHLSAGGPIQLGFPQPTAPPLSHPCCCDQPGLLQTPGHKQGLRG